MTYEQFIEIYNEMITVSNKDKTLTHIDVCFQVRPIKRAPNRARINIKTFNDEIKKSNIR
jgi:hypothetical protein